MRGYFFVITTPLRGNLTVACHCSLCTNISYFYFAKQSWIIYLWPATVIRCCQVLKASCLTHCSYKIIVLINKHHVLFSFSFSFSVSHLESFPKACQNKNDGSSRKLNTESDLNFSFILIFYSQLVSANSLRHSADELHGHSFCEYICLPKVIAQ